MECKIGEIFEYNGEWYQCVIGWRCKDCVFNEERKCYTFTDNNNPIGDCSAERRTDKYSVIFKKLEKVGEPYQYMNGIYQEYKATLPFFIRNATYIETVNGFAIKIKQNKEDMEEKKTNFVEAIDALCKRYNMSDGVRTDFMSELKEIIKNKDKEYNLKPFDLEAAKLGKPVCTRDGRKARIICFDRNDLYPIVALIECEDRKEMIGAYSKEGHTEIYEIKGTDLMMLPEKKEGWMNLYKSSAHPTKEEAMKYRNKCNDYIDTIKVEWRE